MNFLPNSFSSTVALPDLNNIHKEANILKISVVLERLVETMNGVTPLNSHNRDRF